MAILAKLAKTLTLAAKAGAHAAAEAPGHVRGHFATNSKTGVKSWVRDYTRKVAMVERMPKMRQAMQTTAQQRNAMLDPKTPFSKRSFGADFHASVSSLRTQTKATKAGIKRASLKLNADKAVRHHKSLIASGASEKAIASARSKALAAVQARNAAMKR